MTQQTPAIFSDKGLASYGEASEDYELAPIGIASMPEQVKRLAEFGRNGDIYVIHAAEGETVVPMEVLNANPQIKSLLFNQMEEMGLDPNRYVVGNEFNSLNPVTGMPEFFVKKLLRGAKKALKKVAKAAKKVAPVAVPLAATFFGFPAFMGSKFGVGSIGAAALGSGIGTLIGGGSLKDAFKSAAIGGGLAGLGGYLRGGTAGLKASFTGQTPVFNPSTGELIGYQAAATPSQVWGSLTGDAGVVEGAKQSLMGNVGTFNPVEGYTGMGGSALLPAGPGGLLGGRINPATGVPFDAVKFNPTGAPGPAERLFNRVAGGPDASAVVSGGAEAVPTNTQINNEAARLLADPNNILTQPQAVNLASKNIATAAAADTGPLLGSLSPSKLLGIPKEGSDLVDLGIGLGGTYLAGGFSPAETESAEDLLAGRADLGGLRGLNLTPEERERLSDAQKLSERAVDPRLFTPRLEDVVQPTLFSADGGSVQKRAVGGYPRRELLVEGPGTERSDDIPAMLSDGEFVINSRAVRGADPSGRGNRYAGANNLYNIMRNFEMRA